MNRANWMAVRRRLAVLVVALPLLQAGSCVEITERSLINGFFAAVTNVFLDTAAAAADSGLAP